jgi:hypothetical protein
LDKERKEFIAGKHNSRKRLEVAQYEFDTIKKQEKHWDKASKTLAKQHPHLPVVKATEQSGDSVVNAIHDLQATMEEAMRVNTDRLIAHSESMHIQASTCMLLVACELRESRIVSSSAELSWRSFG